MPLSLYNTFLLVWIVLSGVIFLSLFFLPAPYGRHYKKGWGLNIKSRAGWILMESHSFLVMLFLFITGVHQRECVSIVFLIMWEMHYIYRAFIFPCLKSKGTPYMPIAIMFMAIFFNITNGFFNGYFLFHLTDPYPINWFWDFRFIFGSVLFFSGMIIHISSDRILRKLRKPEEKDYRIPYGGFFKWISSPNYFGEILQWFGWALLTWSLAGLAFAIWTVSNLAPRAFYNHIWYKKSFPEYPKERKALIPFIF